MGKKLLILFGTLIAIFLVASAIIYFGSSPTNNSATNETKAEKTSDKTTVEGGKSNSNSIYSQKAKQICNMMEQSYELLNKGDIQKSHDIASSAYWDVYDAVIEIKYRSYASPSQLFEVEQQFHSLAALIEKPMNDNKTAQIKKKMDGICKEVNKEAALLNKELGL